MKYYKINPGGNITAIVRGRFNQKQKVKINKQIMESDPTIEQVGFWTAPLNKKYDARLEMAGGEFCGNALRSLGALLRSEFKKQRFTVESSGTNEPVEIETNDISSTITIPRAGIEYSRGVCTLPGISYIFSSKNISRSQSKIKLEKADLLKQNAAGVIRYKKLKNGYAIAPVIWVKDISTFVEETACGSGTIAFAVLQSLTKGGRKFLIRQPSGYDFFVTISKDTITLGGPIISRKHLLVTRLHNKPNPS